MKLIPVAIVFASLTSPCFAQEQEDYAERVTPITGGAIYDEKMGVDGTLVSEEYMLAHMVCSKGSRKLRYMMPFGLEDDGTAFTLDGAPSSLVKTKAGYTMTFMAGKTSIKKEVVLKPTNDKRAHNAAQFVVSFEKGDALWTAMANGTAMAMIGTGGTAVSLPSGKTFNRFLALCGL